MNPDEPGYHQDPLTAKILAAAFEVSNTLGHGFLEQVYQKALFRELVLADVPVEREVTFKVGYKGAEIGIYVADLVVDRRVIVELKAVERLTSSHIGQCLNYLRASSIKTALLLNFGTARLEYKRVSL